MALDRTNALMAELAKALGIAGLPPGDGSWQLSVGDDADVFIQGGDDATILVVVPIAALPRELEYGLITYLLRRNMYDSPTAPFQVAVDDAGSLLFWGRLPTAELDGASLAAVIDGVAAAAAEMRPELLGTAAA